MNLAAYASNPVKSQGRIYKELQSQSRNDFQRDRDRIIHSASFRRLQYKTQVFVNHEGDMFRSRLTHSLEVSQIARAVARTLNCHEDLCEAVALAHDLGHTPFGHAGQDALNFCMQMHGGFEHNLQSLRIVDQLEKRYASFDGLNLTFEVREGILKHCSLKNAKKLGDIGLRFLNKKQPSLEAQIVNLADEIAYLHHDLDDGFRSGILNLATLKELMLFEHYASQVEHDFEKLSDDKLLNETIRRMMHSIIDDLCKETMMYLQEFKPKSADEVRESPRIVRFSETMAKHLKEIKLFSTKHLYRHPRIIKMSSEAEETIKRLFNFYCEHFDLIPSTFLKNTDCKERAVADYIAGMTDRYARQCSTTNVI